MGYYTPLLGTIPLTLQEIAFIQNLASEAGYDSAVIPIVSSGSGVPSTTPGAIGEIYIDTTNDNVYVAIGTASVADWLQVNGGGGGAVDSVNGQVGVVVLDADDIDDTSTTHKFTSQAEIDKLAGIQAGAEVNVNADWNATSGDAQILNKPSLATVATSGDYNDLSNLPDLTLFDNLESYANLASFPATGALDKLYLAQDTGELYRWDGATYVGVSTSHAPVTFAGIPDYITLVGQVITRGLINLASHVTGRLPFANLSTLSAHQVLGRAGTGTGDAAGITMGNDTILGRSGSGDVSALSASQVRTILNVADGATAYTDENAQDAVGAMVANSTFVSLAYNDGTPSLTASLSATGTPSATTFLRGDNTWATVTGGSNTYINTVYVDQAGGTSDTYGVLGGTRNGSNTVFTVSQGVYATGTLKVWRNGQLMTQGSGEDFVETTPASGTFTFAVAPAATDEITVEYQRVTTTASSVVYAVGDVDIEITDPTKGLILTSPDLTRWRITIGNDGALSATSL